MFVGLSASRVSGPGKVDAYCLHLQFDAIQRA